jgi:hypothetical protein
MTTLIFGDSFIGPFSLIDDGNIFIYKFSGKSMKGITKKEDKDRKKIINIVNNSKNTNCLIFNFGQVDLYFSYYYKKFIKNEKFMMTSLVKKYVEFINSLNCKNCNKIIISVYPTVLKDENVFNSLLYYKIISNYDIKSIKKTDIIKTSKFNFRYNMYKKFNNLLEKYCKIYNINYINLDDVLLNKKTNKIKHQFINPSTDVSIHLLWEPLIPILVDKITKCNIVKKYKINLKKSLKKYIIEKKKLMKNK